MKVRGMEVVREKLSKDEVDKRLRRLFHYKIRGGSYRGKWGVGMRISKKEEDKLFAEMKELKAKQKPSQSEWTEEDVIALLERNKKTDGAYCGTVQMTGTKKARKKFKTPIAKCLGTSRNKCPKKRCGNKLKIWVSGLGVRELLCPRCGWTTRVIDPSTRI